MDTGAHGFTTLPFNPISQFLDHLAYDAMPALLNKPSVQRPVSKNNSGPGSAVANGMGISSLMGPECNRISDQLASTINGEAWYGDSLRQILEDVTAAQALAHPIPNAHSIWELLCHVEAWVKFALGAVAGTPIPPWPAMPVELDWPVVADTSETAWKRAVYSFFSHHLKLVETIRGFSDERLEAPVPGRTYNFYRLFQSTTQHAVYHAGQIALLKKKYP